MDDAELLRRSLDQEPDDPAARERARARLRVEVEKATRHPRRPRKVPVLVGLAVTATVLTLVAIVVPATRESAAAKELRRLGSIASSQPPLVPKPGEILVWTAEAFHLEGFTDVVTDTSFDLFIRSSLDRRTDARGEVVREETIRSVEFASDDDREAWEAAGSPELPEAGDVRRERIRPGENDWFDLEAISTDPAVLVDAIRDGEVAPLPPGDDEVFLMVGQLLREPTLSGGQRAALFEVAADLPGVEPLGEVEDPLGRVGTGFALEAEGRRAVIIFDPDTARPLATELYQLGSGGPELVEWTAFEDVEIA